VNSDQEPKTVAPSRSILAWGSIATDPSRHTTRVHAATALRRFGGDFELGADSRYPGVIRLGAAECPMDFLYSLYDALVSINVPNDKARAVVDAMERDMATHLATKTDLDSLRLATRADVELLRRDTESGFLALRKDIGTLEAALRKDIETLEIVMRKDLDAMGSQIVIRLGALLVVIAGLVLGALQLG